MSQIANMEVKVSADISDLQKGYDKASSDTKQFVSKTTQSLSGLKTGSNQAGQALSNLGRIAQDAPFGFIGISNNINPLLESFQRLKAETGSTGTALKSLGSSLLGAGGIGIAVSVISGLLVVFGDKLFAGSKAIQAINLDLITFSEVIKTAENDLKEFNKESDYLQKLNNANITERFGNDFNAKLLSAKAGFIAIGEEIVKTEDAIKTLTDNSNSAFKFFLDNATKETRAFVGTFNGITAAIPDALIGKLPEDQQALVKAIKETDKALVDQQLRLKDLTREKEIAAASNRAIVAENRRDDAEKARREAERLAKLPSISKTIAELGRELDFLSAKEIVFKTTTTPEKIRAITSTIEKLIKDFKVAPDDTLISKLIGTQFSDLFGKNAAQAVKNIGDLQIRSAIKEKLKKVFFEGPQTIVPLNATFKLPDGALPKLLVDASGQIETFFSGLANSIANGFGETIAGVLSGTSSIGDFFKGIFSSLGSGLKQLGAYFIKTGIQIKLVKSFLLKNPALAIAGGIALVALGSLIQSQTNIPGFANGVQNFRGGLAVVGERGPELVNLPAGASVTPNHMLGTVSAGSDRVQVTGRIVASGKDLVVLIDNSRQSLNRQS